MSFHAFTTLRCELEGHAVSPDTGLDIDIVETIDYQDFFEVLSFKLSISIIIIIIFTHIDKTVEYQDFFEIVFSFSFPKVFFAGCDFQQHNSPITLMCKVPLGERSFLPEPYLVCAGRTMDRKLQPIPDAVE